MIITKNEIQAKAMMVMKLKCATVKMMITTMTTIIEMKMRSKPMLQ